MILFFFTLTALILSSYFITGLIKDKKSSVNILYLILIAISQIIISVEVLSLFKAITRINIQIIQFVFLIIFTIIWTIFNKPKPKLLDTNSIKNIFSAIKEDKFLMILSFGLCFSALISFYIGISTSTNIDDDMAYHLPRICQWIQNHSFAHFQTNDVRQLQFPINSEILYLWSMLQLKSDVLIKLVEYIAYFVSLFVLYNFLDLNKVSEKQKLWAVFMLASLPLIIIESSSLQTNVLVGCLAFTAIYLFLYSIVESRKIPLIFSGISLAIAVGVKTTAVFLLPIIAFTFLIISIKELGTKFYKPLLTYMALFTICFIILALPNYLLNYFDFQNPLGMGAFLSVHKNTGFDVFIANIIRYLTALFDFSGIKQAEIISPYVIHLKNTLLHLSHIPVEKGVLFNSDIYKTNTKIHEQLSLFGILGFLVLLPYSIRSLYLSIFKKDREHLYINLCGAFFILYILILSAAMNYMTEMNRYLASVAIISSPIFIFTYFDKTKIAKVLLCLIMIFNFLVIPTNIISRPFFKIIKAQREKGFIRAHNDFMYTRSGNIGFFRPEKELIQETTKLIPNGSAIGLITDFDENLYPIYTPKKNYRIMIITDLYTNKEELLKNDYLITNIKTQTSTYYKPFKELPKACVYKFAKEGLKNHLECTINKDLINQYFKQIKVVEYRNSAKYIIYRKNVLGE